MDAFFASVEQRDNPALRGKPIAVTGGGERTVITTSSYEARAYGVKTAMTVYEAKRLCPHIILVTGNNRKYAQICTMLEEICLRFTPDIEIYSIDEVFLDITGSHHLFGGPENLAQSIKDTVKNELGITCTVGMGPNILIAKLASDLAKPDGFRWIGEDAVPSVLETLPVKKLWGIGPHTEEKLRAMGITTCGELGRASLPLLAERFGIIGERLKAMGNGRLERPLEIVPPEPKSIGHSITLPKDIWKREEITSCLLRLSERVGRRARRYGHKGKKITLTVQVCGFQNLYEADHPACLYERYRRNLPLRRRHPRWDTPPQERAAPRHFSLSASGKMTNRCFSFKKRSGRRKPPWQRPWIRVNDKFGEHTITLCVNHHPGRRSWGYFSVVASIRGEEQ